MRIKAMVLFLTECAAIGCGMSGRRDSDSIGISVPYELDSLDPHARDTLSDFSIASNLYEPLVRFDAEMRIQPALASSWETPDPLTWVFEIRSGVHFHDGKLLTPEDVVYSFRRLRDHPELEMRAYAADVSEVAAIGVRQVRIRTKLPRGAFLNKLNFVLIVPRGSTPDRLNRRVDGTGPYTLDARKSGDSIRLIQNNGYWGKAAPFSTVEFHLARDPDGAIADLLSGRSQLIQSSSKKMKSAIQATGRHELLLRDSLYVKYLGYDMWRDATPYCSTSSNPFRNVLVRQAINVAIDREQLVAALSTHAIPCWESVPRSVFGFNPMIPPPSPNPLLAKKLLTRAGYPDGFAITLHTRRILAETAVLVQAQLARVGIQVEIEALPDDRFFGVVERHEASFFISRFGCPTGDAGFILENAVHSPDPNVPYGGSNWGQYANASVDRAIEECGGLLLDTRRLASLQSLMWVLTEDLPRIPLYSDQDVYAIERAYSWQPRNDGYILANEIRMRE
ncbi:MAG: hypothetical protein HYX75_02240 [Acidobacteria bacterium]|nr:hypothetical protein [Acidobacteriota bacterium]